MEEVELNGDPVNDPKEPGPDSKDTGISVDEFEAKNPTAEIQKPGPTSRWQSLWNGVKTISDVLVDALEEGKAYADVTIAQTKEGLVHEPQTRKTIEEFHQLCKRYKELCESGPLKLANPLDAQSLAVLFQGIGEPNVNSGISAKSGEGESAGKASLPHYEPYERAMGLLGEKLSDLGMIRARFMQKYQVSFLDPIEAMHGPEIEEGLAKIGVVDKALKEKIFTGRVFAQRQQHVDAAKEKLTTEGKEKEFKENENEKADAKRKANVANMSEALQSAVTRWDIAREDYAAASKEYAFASDAVYHLVAQMKAKQAAFLAKRAAWLVEALNEYFEQSNAASAELKRIFTEALGDFNEESIYSHQFK